MDDTTLDTVTDDDLRPAGVADTEPTDDGIDEDLLVEEVSIDGMCGVY
jgi:mycofactocin precursor